MLTKVIVTLVFLLILGSLASALLYLVKDRGNSSRTVRALTVRIGLSFILFICVIIAGRLGWIKPHSIKEGWEQSHAAQP